MAARWAGFAVGLWLVLAPLVLGYETAGAVLHDVAIGVVVCVGTLAALEWPAARVAQLLPAAWLVGAPRAIAWESPAVAANQLAAGIVLAALVAVPSARLSRRPAQRVADASRA
jgi:hypothetical protein